MKLDSTCRRLTEPISHHSNNTRPSSGLKQAVDEEDDPEIVLHLYAEGRTEAEREVGTQGRSHDTHSQDVTQVHSVAKHAAQKHPET